MPEKTPRAGDLCRECGTPLEVADALDESDPSGGEVLVLRCANGHTMTVRRHPRSGSRG